FEHRIYLPLWGILLAAIDLWHGALDILKRRIENRGDAGFSRFFSLKTALFCGGFLSLGTVAALTHLTTERNQVWQSDVSLWSDVVAKSPKKSRAYMNLSKAYASEQVNYEKAEAFLSQAVALDPDWPILWINLTELRSAVGHHTQAIEAWERARAMTQDGVGTMALAAALRNARQFERAREVLNLELQKIESLKSEKGGTGTQIIGQRGHLLVSLSKVEYAAGANEEGLKAAQAAVDQLPDSSYAWLMLAKGNLRLARLPNALEAAKTTLVKDPTFTEAHLIMAEVLWQSGDLDGAARSLQQGLSGPMLGAETYAEYVSRYQALGDRAVPLSLPTVQKALVVCRRATPQCPDGSTLEKIAQTLAARATPPASP
ncbi:hypothetical protein E3A20_24210, partial [Planctomyces bekefii]